MERRFKVCLLGEGRVGKTSILLRVSGYAHAQPALASDDDPLRTLQYIKNAFDERQVSTLTASCFDKQVPLGNGEVRPRARRVRRNHSPLE